MSYRVQARIGVAAPASAVWAVISDLERWGTWNPLFPVAEGRLSIGALLTLKRVLATKGEQHEVRVVDWVPDAQIVWSRSIAPFARSLSYLEIEALTERGCILAVGEIYDGLIGDYIGKRDRRALNAGLKALCEAAKARAEETWDGVPDDPLPPPAPPPPVRAKPTTLQLTIRGGKR